MYIVWVSAHKFSLIRSTLIWSCWPIVNDFMISDLSSVKCFRVHSHGPELCCCKQVLGALGGMGDLTISSS